ncbi:helix-turn-helix transcriptional regulator [Oscillospiraceae bacterium 50-58]
MTKLSERLYSLRKERNLTQLLAAEGMGIPFSTYRRYEKKEREPDVSVLVQIADFYDVSLDYLVGRSEKRER